GAKQLPPIPPRQNGKRGRVAKSDAHNLWERLKKHETAVLPLTAMESEAKGLVLGSDTLGGFLFGYFRNDDRPQKLTRVKVSHLSTGCKA
ncbi:hypothetical protein, partial [Thiolapillus sp.]|uniref:hypothetical protein n=1 Tax=Thiolapillus sp. TaxID=2017437 RepID=UPI003AF58465